MSKDVIRKCLPTRRHSWRQCCRIGSQTIYLTVGEYDDGSPGEIFIDIAKAGTLLRGTCDALARVISVALQCGTPLQHVLTALRGLDYPPQGSVMNSSNVKEAKSVADWIAMELTATYLKTEEKVAGKYTKGSGY